MFSLISRSTLQGTPTATTLGGMDLVTTLPPLDKNIAFLYTVLAQHCWILDEYGGENMICKNCGATIEEGANYCTQCGAGVNPTNAGRQAEQTAYQPNENAYYSAGPNPVYQQPFGGQAPQKSKIAAGLLAILLGSLGIHKFYLGYTKSGVIMLLVSLLTFGIGAAVMEVIGIIEGIIYLTKTDQEFYQTYEAQQKEWF